MISFVLTNTIMKTMATSTSPRLYLPALFRGSVAKFKVRLYESFIYIVVVPGRSSPGLGSCCASAAQALWPKGFPTAFKRKGEAGEGRGNPVKTGEHHLSSCEVFVGDPGN